MNPRKLIHPCFSSQRGRSALSHPWVSKPGGNFTTYLSGHSFIQATKKSLISPRVDGEYGQRNDKK